MLKKEYKYMAPPVAKDEKPDEFGIAEYMLDFDWERDVEPQVCRHSEPLLPQAATRLRIALTTVSFH